MKTADMLGNYCCIASSETDGSKFSVLIDTTDMTSKNNYAEASIHNVILLFVENSIMRDEIIYENEHDKLTGLYNKAKYIALKKENFGDPGTICIYNFDVNNLKYINDHFGHEFGGKLIVKAAKSIAAVSSDKVLGFRMGGDEFVMIAIGLSEEQSEQLRDKWRAALGELNKDEDGLFISMACGMAFGRGDYDYDELYAEADSLMYENKKELKANGLCSHIIGVE